MGVPLADGVKLTEHAADDPLPDSEHDPPFVKLPGPLELKLTAPEGVTGLALVSVTVAVSDRGVLRVTLALVAPVEATVNPILAAGQV